MTQNTPAGACHLGADELARLRRQTPALGHRAHFAHGSASLPPQAVYAAWDRWLSAERSMGVHGAMEFLAQELAGVRQSAARLIGAQPHQIALLDSASHAWASAMSAVLAASDDVHVVSTHDEYGSNSLCLLAAHARLGLTVIPGRDGDGPLQVRLAQALSGVPARSRVVVSLSAVPTAHGVATDLRGIAQVVRQRDGLLFVDASHAVGQLPVDVGEWGCDVLVFPARKWLRGPKGIAVLYVSDRALAHLGVPGNVDVAGARWTQARVLHAHADARRFEGQEFNPGLRLALKAACDGAWDVGVERIAARNAEVRSAVVQALREGCGWEPLEGAHPRATALLTYALPDSAGDGDAWMRALSQAGVNASVVGMQHASWALEAMGVPALLRLTPHYITGEDEVQRLVLALRELQRLPLKGGVARWDASAHRV